MIYQAIYDSPLGDISVQSDGENVTALYFVGQRYDGTMEEGSFESLESLPLWKTVKTYLMCYFKGKQPDPGMLPLAPKGTAFQKRVWQKLLAIPYGNVTTYGAIAAEIAKEDGKPHFSAQAVGNAVGRNPISIIIPWPPSDWKGWLADRICGRNRKEEVAAGERKSAQKSG